MFEEIDPFTASPSELLASVVDLEPGPFAESVLLMIDRTKLSGDDAVTFLQVLERVAAFWASVQADVLVAAASPERLVDDFTMLDPRPGHDEARSIRIEDAVREEVAAAVRWSPAIAQHRIDTARLLAGPLSAAKCALALGEISSGHVGVLVEAASRLPGRHATSGSEREAFHATCAELQRRVLPIARRGTLAATRAASRRAVLAIDAEGERQRRERARCTRSVFVIDELDGISTLIARMSTPTAHQLYAAIDARAKRDTADTTKPMDERRADALADLVLDGASTDGTRSSAHVDVVIDLETLLGLADSPAALVGSGPVTADIVRDLLGDPTIACTMRRLVADPVTGHLLDVGRHSYEIPEGLRRYVVTRDRTCRFPGCRRNAARCQIDHAVAWDVGGGTDADNLGALCIRHHQLKTHAGWEITESQGDGRCTWISPQGRRYLHEPGPLT